jgi:hypothetical protein
MHQDGAARRWLRGSCAYVTGIDAKGFASTCRDYY